MRARVKELLGEVSASEVSSKGMVAIVTKADELLEVDPTDTRHMFWEKIKRLFYAMKESSRRTLTRRRWTTPSPQRMASLMSFSGSNGGDRSGTVSLQQTGCKFKLKPLPEYNLGGQG